MAFESVWCKKKYVSYVCSCKGGGDGGSNFFFNGYPILLFLFQLPP